MDNNKTNNHKNPRDLTFGILLYKAQEKLIFNM